MWGHLVLLKKEISNSNKLKEVLWVAAIAVFSFVMNKLGLGRQQKQFSRILP